MTTTEITNKISQMGVGDGQQKPTPKYWNEYLENLDIGIAVLRIRIVDEDKKITNTFGSKYVGKDKENVDAVWINNKAIMQKYKQSRIRFLPKLGSREKIIFAQDTRKYAVMDIDSSVMLNHPFIQYLLQNYPYTSSVNQKLPKIIMFIINMPPHLEKLNNIVLRRDENRKVEVEIQTGMWSFFDENAHIENGEKEDITIEWSNIAEHFGDCISVDPCLSPPELGGTKSPDKKYTKKQVCKMLGRLNQETADTYETWRNVGFALKGWDEKEGWKLYHEWSQTSPKYVDEVDCRIHWNKFGHGNMSIITTYFQKLKGLLIILMLQISIII